MVLEDLAELEGACSTTVSDGMYYEITHNGDKKETYLDVYKKWENQCIADGNTAH